MTGTDDEEQSGWAEICAGFHDIRYAAAIGFQEQWKECVRETQDRRGSLDRWRALVAEIAKAHGLDTDFTGRNGASGDVARDMEAFFGKAAPSFACPMDVCSRREPPRTTGAPKCDLFDVDMRTV